MKKPGTPVPSMISKRRHQQTVEELFKECKSDIGAVSIQSDGLGFASEESLQVIGATSANMGQKRVKFNQKQDKVHEYEKESEEEDEASKEKENADDDPAESESLDSADFSEDICGSDNEDMESGLFFDYIERERKR